jgi:acid stress-induced BolA-like protein IbaG/YrbA
MDPTEIKSLIERHLPDAQADVHTDGQGHYEARVVSPAFEGKRSIARHQLVYGALGQRVGREIHALAIKTFTPEEWRAAGN